MVLLAGLVVMPPLVPPVQAAILCNGAPIDRNQTLCMQAFSEADTETVLLLFKGRAGQAKRAVLMAERDHLVRPDRSPLAYHISLLEVLTLCTLGKNYAVRGTVPHPSLFADKARNACVDCFLCVMKK